MPRRLLLVALALACFATSAFAQARTSWQMNQGEGIVFYPTPSCCYGSIPEYAYATIPPANEPGWGPAPDGNIIAFSRPSTLCGVADCLTAGDFTYFQTFVDIPGNMTITEFNITFSGIDDGVRVTIFNSLYPAGIVVPGSYVFLGGSGTANLASLVYPGEPNRIVVTHIDDCCSGCYLNRADVVINGDVVATRGSSWGHLKSLYR